MYRVFKAQEAGWLRRPELDQDGGFAFEKPNGDIYLSAVRDLEIGVPLPPEIKLHDHHVPVRAYPKRGELDG